jgi:tetratricopeptide (TPR) repeat protein
VKSDYFNIFVKLLLLGMIVYFIQPAIQAEQIYSGLKKARYLIDTRQPVAAETQLLAIQSIEPWRDLPWSELAELYFDRGKPDQVIKILEPGHNVNPLTAADWLLLAKAYDQIGRPSRVEEALLAVIALHDSGTETISAYQMLINLFRSQNRFFEALDRQTELVKLSPATKAFKFEKITLLLAIDPVQGLKEWQAATGKPDWLLQLGRQIDSAMHEDDKALRFVKIGRAFGGSAFWDYAEYWLQQAVMNSPTYAEAWAFLAESREKRGLDGKDQIIHALDLAPDSPGVRALGSLYYRRHREFNTAIALIQKNIDDQPSQSVWYV